MINIEKMIAFEEGKKLKASKWYKQTPNRVNRLIKLINDVTITN